jgi:hypothetical protein
MVTVDFNSDGTDELVAAFPGYGLYKKDSSKDLQLINNVNPDRMIAAYIDGNGDDDLVAAFTGYGLYYYTDPGGWSTPINGIIPDVMVRYSDGLVCDFGGAYGLWSYNLSDGWGVYICAPGSGTWRQPPINTVIPDQIIAVDIDGDGNDELMVSFLGYGLYTYELEDGTWHRINTVVPEGMIRLGNGIAADYGETHGLWVWSHEDDWGLRNTADPSGMVTVDIDTDGVEELVVSFIGYGLYYHDETNGWQFMNGEIPCDVKPMNFYPYADLRSGTGRSSHARSLVPGEPGPL